MQIYIDSYGAYLHVRNGKFQVALKHNPTQSFATDDVDVIFLTEGATATADALMLALDKNIPVIFLNYLGQPVGQVWSGQFGSIATIRRNQLHFSEHTEGWLWMSQTLASKVDKQALVLRQLTDKYPVLFTEKVYKKLGSTLSTLDGLAKNLKRYTINDTDFKRVAMDFRAYEATASRHYFRFMASLILNPKWQFESRSFNPATDYFNCLLNYLYGMLYAQVELSLVKVGIDPSIGVLHVDRHNRPTLVYDFIEPYRHWAETVALDLALEDAVSDEGFIPIPEDDKGGLWLGSKAKSIVIGRFLSFLNEAILFNKKQQKRLMVLDLEAQKLASQLKNFKISNA